MTLSQSGMVMNANTDTLPRDCKEIRSDYEFEVLAGTEFAKQFPGSIFAYDRNEFKVEPCSRIRVTFVNRDETRHQWMVHGLPRYLYPGGMFHLEVAGGATVSGSFIVPGDQKTYLVHCDISQHMEKGMKAQLKVGRGSGDLWAVPGVSEGLNRASYLPGHTFKALFALFLAIPFILFAIRNGRSQ
jgi:plastocyanin